MDVRNAMNTCWQTLILDELDALDRREHPHGLPQPPASKNPTRRLETPKSPRCPFRFSCNKKHSV